MVEMTGPVSVTMLGQSGVRLVFGNTTVYIDPYLTNSVAEKHGRHLDRMVPPPFSPAETNDAAWVLITHPHDDHFDPDTLAPLATASANAGFIVPASAVQPTKAVGISASRIVEATPTPMPLSPGLSVRAIPAAHPHVTRAGKSWEAVGYLFDWNGKRLYHSGDTSADTEIIDTLAAFGPIDIAFLPVNERNFFRERAGIIGNMSVREAFQFAEEIKAKRVVPIHWDLFKPNSVSSQEIQLAYKILEPSFELLMSPTQV